MAITELSLVYDIETRPFSPSITPFSVVSPQDSFMSNVLLEKESGDRVTIFRRPGCLLQPSLSPGGTPQGIFSATNSNVFRPLIAVSNTIYDSSFSSSYTLSTTPARVSFVLSDSGDATPYIVFQDTTNVYYCPASSPIASSLAVSSQPWTLVGAKLAPGIVYLQGTYYVMDVRGNIYGSNISDPSVWSALNLVRTNVSPDSGIVLERYYNYICGFGRKSVQFFYNAGNALGSPLSPVPNTYLEIGCVDARSISKVNDELIWVARTINGSLKVAMLSGLQYKIVSTPSVERLLQLYAGSTGNFYGTVVNINGKTVYLLRLNKTDGSNEITLAYDFVMNHWSYWVTQNFIGAVNPVSMVLDPSNNLVVTLTFATDPGIDEQAFVYSGGTVPTDYTGFYPLTKVSSLVYQYTMLSVPSVPISGTSQIFRFTPVGFISYQAASIPTFAGDLPYVMFSNGTVGILDQSNTSDFIVSTVAATPISVDIRTIDLNFGTEESKFLDFVEVVADKNPSKIWIKQSTNDANSYSKWRPINLNTSHSRIFQFKKFVKMSLQFSFWDAQFIRFEKLFLKLTKETE